MAPTATGKSLIGREAIRRALLNRGTATHAYLVPYRALATEVFESFMDLLEGTDARVRITTGDYRDPIRPEEADLVVATYESFVALLRRTGFRPGIVVADEVHLLGDDHRGPVVEGLLARLRAMYSFASGFSGISYSLSSAMGSRVRAEVYIDVGDADENSAIFDGVMQEKERLEREFGEELGGEPLEEKRACRVAIYRPGNIDDQPAVLEEIEEWGIEKLLKIKGVLALRSNAWSGEDEQW